MPNLKKTVARMKREILHDVALGVLPRIEFLTSFYHLHDFVDANEYGGFCDEEVTDQLTRELDDSTDALLAFMNEAQSKVDNWLARA